MIDEEALSRAVIALAKFRTGDIKDWPQYTPEAECVVTAYLTALEARGYVIVPSEPTEAMVKAGSIPLRGTGPQMDIAPSWPELLAESTYRAMLAARGEG